MAESGAIENISNLKFLCQVHLPKDTFKNTLLSTTNIMSTKVIFTKMIGVSMQAQSLFMKNLLILETLIFSGQTFLGIFLDSNEFSFVSMSLMHLYSTVALISFSVPFAIHFESIKLPSKTVEINILDYFAIKYITDFKHKAKFICFSN